MISAVEQSRVMVSRSTEAKKKSLLGQFLTPASTAQFMASLFRPAAGGDCRLLDPGAGIGSLTSAFLERCVTGEMDFGRIKAEAFEVDNSLLDNLNRSFSFYINLLPLSYKVFEGDFIEESVRRIILGDGGFTHAILNPPYKKINSKSCHRRLLRKVGIETVNLYSAFVALVLMQMEAGGQVVAIIPRSFCNGPYYRPFRNIILKDAAIRHIHLFGARDRAFRDDAVLQENVIIMLVKGEPQGDVIISKSTDDTFSDLYSHRHRFDRIVFPDDGEHFIHIPDTDELDIIERSTVVRYSLEEIGIQVSTGPVVDFRLKKYLKNMPGRGTVPLLYPIHLNGQSLEWPKPESKKPNAIQYNSDTKKWLMPDGFYCAVRRFSSKEERKRVVAGVVRPNLSHNAGFIGFENHLNVYHEGKRGLPEALARGLAVFLNTSAVDENFRRFNGHTQVNATDLRKIKYPSRECLTVLGEWAMNLDCEPTQAMIDEQFQMLDGE